MTRSGSLELRTPLLASEGKPAIMRKGKLNSQFSSSARGVLGTAHTVARRVPVLGQTVQLASFASSSWRGSSNAQAHAHAADVLMKMDEFKQQRRLAKLLPQKLVLMIGVYLRMVAVVVLFCFVPVHINWVVVIIFQFISILCLMALTTLDEEVPVI